jgi:hypothetical protein
MTIEELQAALEKAQTSISKLEQKNSELIDREKAAKDRAEEAEASTGSELEKATKRADKAERDLKAANDRADTNANSLRSFKAENAINQAIATANVDAKHVALLSKAMRADVEFSDDGEPLIGGKTVDVYAKTFFAKDGLAYVRASNNTGGLATGNDGTGAGMLSKRPETADEWNTYYKMTDAERNAFDQQHSI